MLDEFIKKEIAKPFVWGETDCCTTADRWVKTKTGISPLANYGRLVIDEEHAKSWLDAESIFSAIKSVMRETPFLMTKSPDKGDIGVIMLTDRIGAMAIHTGKRWFTRNESGLIMTSLDAILLRAWCIECPD